ncbi:CUE domain-containing protein [Colletotrichum orchidophilum]|uniref:CUE domain-containing protein n=1 Tax=Colletotrichum orchidophilum TaxID=1209926 RepID=A0A1G4BL49_9PEZI|nr:CUE domain-containing protein [Colletotrichum orchidophilum]OHF02026.1 CUE domain-containing protein [Colletotrichum orchidophilum]
MSASLPPLAPFPSPSWRAKLTSPEWDALLEAWTTLTQAYLALSDKDLSRAATKEDSSIPVFLTSFTTQVAEAGPSPTLGSSSSSVTSKALLRTAFTLTSRLLTNPSTPPPTQLTIPPFLCAFTKLYRKNAPPTLSKSFHLHASHLEQPLAGLKKSLAQSMEAGLKADLKSLEARLANLNHLLHASPHAAAFFLAGSDFFDGLVTAFKITNPPLRKVLVATMYLCLVGLTEGEQPRFGMLADVLFSLKSAAETHRAGPLNVNDSLVAELVTVTPVLRQLSKRAEEKGAASTALRSRISALEGFKKPGGGMMRPKRLIRRKVDKGKGKDVADEGQVQAELHIHRQSQISLIQDLFPDLGSGFISKLFDEYGDNTEIVTAHLLEDSLPPYLATADRAAPLSPTLERRKSQLEPRPTPPQLPERHNVFDDDELDRLDLDVSKLHFGKKGPEKTADDVLKDRSTAPNKAAILSALAAFDSDDDERDDTYDADDVGGTVDNANEEADGQKDAGEETLYKAFQADPSVFDRQATTRRGQARGKLREETGMTDEAIEGWAVMLARNPGQNRRLEAKYSGNAAFTGTQTEILSTAWRASPAGSGAEEPESGGGSSFRGGGGGRGRGGRGRGGRGGGGRGGGNVAGPTGEKETEAARRRKEASKSSRANHNRRDQRAKKMARGGFPG